MAEACGLYNCLTDSENNKIASKCIANKALLVPQYVSRINLPKYGNRGRVLSERGGGVLQSSENCSYCSKWPIYLSELVVFNDRMNAKHFSIEKENIHLKDFSVHFLQLMYHIIIIIIIISYESHKSYRSVLNFSPTKFGFWWN